MALVKARLQPEVGDALECQFNPETYNYSKSVSTNATATPRKDTPDTQVSGGNPATVDFTLFFDTYVGEEQSMEDVREKYTDKLLALMTRSTSTLNADSNTQSGRPPVVTFYWGRGTPFRGLITSCTLTFTLFNSQGTPVRAKAAVKMTQVVDDKAQPAQNPTSGGEGLRARYVVQPGDTLDLIAYREYRDSTRWRLLAEVNGLENPRTLRPGQRLLIPNT